VNFLRKWIELEKSVFSNWKMILNISKKEFKKEFAGSRLGIVWALLRPIAMILVFWVVFGMVFSGGAQDGPLLPNGTYEKVPYLVWLVAGYVPWIFISDYIVAGASSIRNSAFLVKKVKFPVQILQSIRLMQSFYTFLIFLGINFIIMAFNGWLGKINYLLLIYAIIVTVIFMSALARLLSTWVVMSVDFMHAIGISMQFLFWLSPVMWAMNQMVKPMMAGDYAQYTHLAVSLVKLNPLTYLVLMFRDAYLGTDWVSMDFFGMPGWTYTVYFFVITIILFIIGTRVFNKFRPEFDDVL
jgi:teichoic acid transport system permease protein